MSLRLWRRKAIAPGLRLNLSRSGVSLSVGRKGMWYTAGPRGRRMTVGAPGTGLFWTEHYPARQAQNGAPRQSLWQDAAELAGVVACAFIGTIAFVTALIFVSLILRAFGQ